MKILQFELREVKEVLTIQERQRWQTMMSDAVALAKEMGVPEPTLELIEGANCAVLHAPWAVFGGVQIKLAIGIETLRRLTREELVGVAAHELSHAKLQHGGKVTFLPPWPIIYIWAWYRRRDEYAADAHAVMYVPFEHYLSALHKIHDYLDATFGPQDRAYSKWAATHPSFEERYEAILVSVKKTGSPDPVKYTLPQAA